ncbi:peptidylprolyl isomerase [Methylophilus medardicus]|uniref:Peptidyl-prolyl cis-trans isomerase n=1 Tax=Methylophilus medardicus TaxID=2588534 RepID=A0A5B8CUD6_9PROT|nr:peptidylprolyl isomerase [Methylophilus medardicus]QDC44859.1 peptidyl-prolyl cis-trans isomerase [Methylophilus medardicus]QDC49866.1 peptidyl-prolyl cis-trans isomerase [Methylophilus medardicus]QDC53571.1 peptidyl-prolyl cis-trans isomerase [Methylophilus medardicus]
MRVLSWMLGCCLFAAVAGANAATQVMFETNQGTFAVEVYPEKAPKTVENFLQYVKDGFYTNTIFHRVIGRFMMQGGGFDRELNEKPTRAPVINEAGNGLVNQTGTIAMARTPDPNSATAQFFINVADNQFLDYSGPEPDRIGYCVFGKVVSGMDVVFKISNLPTGNQRGFSDVPIRTVIIKRATIVTSK